MAITEGTLAFPLDTNGLSGEGFVKTDDGFLYLPRMDPNKNLLTALGSQIEGENATDHALMVEGQTRELALPNTGASGAFQDMGSVNVANIRSKVLYVSVTSALGWTTSGNVTVQLYTGRTAFTAAAGAASTLDANHPYVGPKINLLATAGTSLPVGTYVITPTGGGAPAAAGAVTISGISDLQWPQQHVGAEIVFPSSPSSGAMALFIWACGN